MSVIPVNIVPGIALIGTIRHQVITWNYVDELSTGKIKSKNTFWVVCTQQNYMMFKWNDVIWMCVGLNLSGSRHNMYPSCRKFKLNQEQLAPWWTSQLNNPVSNISCQSWFISSHLSWHEINAVIIQCLPGLSVSPDVSCLSEDTSEVTLGNVTSISIEV